MIRNLTIKVKLIIYVTLILSGAILFVSLSTYFTSKTELQNTIKERFEVMTELKTNDIKGYFEKIHSGLKLLQNSTVLQKTLPKYISYISSDNDSIKKLAITYQEVVNDEFESVKKAYGYEQIVLLDPKTSEIFYGTNSRKAIDSKIDPALIRHAHDTLVHSTVYSVNNSKSSIKMYNMYTLSPMYDSEGNLEAIMCVEIQLSPLFKQVQNITGLGKTGEVVLGTLEKNKAIIINPLRHNKDAALTTSIKIGDPLAIPLQKCVGGESGYGVTKDYRGDKVLAIWRFIPQVNWGIVYKIDEQEVFKPLAKLKGRVMIMSTVLLVFVILISAIFADRFIRPIVMIRDNIISLANGRFPKKIKYYKKDEIGETVDSLNVHIKNLKNSTEFASKIGKGDLEFNINEDGKNDVLSSSLISMKKSLVEVAEENDRRKWATEGQALHVEILRNNSKNIEQLCSELIRSLIPYVEGNYGAIYSVEVEKKEKYLLLRSTYAYHGETKKDRIEIGQSLVGQCALERKTIKVNEAPEDFVKLSSGLGDSYPTHLIIVPLMVNDVVYGVIEIGSFSIFKDYQIDFLEKLGESIGSTILAVQSAEKNQELLESFQKSSLASTKVAIVDKLKEQKAKLKEDNQKLKDEIEVLKRELDNK